MQRQETSERHRAQAVRPDGDDAGMPLSQTEPLVLASRDVSRGLARAMDLAEEQGRRTLLTRRGVACCALVSLEDLRRLEELALGAQRRCKLWAMLDAVRDRVRARALGGGAVLEELVHLLPDIEECLKGGPAAAAPAANAPAPAVRTSAQSDEARP